jgi:RNA polymerase sigma-70 factor (ECF subfamily)
MTAVNPTQQATKPAREQFGQLAEPYRRELKLHCYRMLGSLHEADDLVQETYLRAWRSFDTFEGSGSLRGWLYRIATNACLNAIEARKHARRVLPDQQGPAAAMIAMPDGPPPTEVAWLEPYPDAYLEGIADDAPNPEARYTAREAVQLAFVAAIQQLPPRQRAALLLCDVLGWAAAETATLLGGSTASINSALQRARDTLANIIRKADRLKSRAQRRHNNNCSIAICALGKVMTLMDSSRCSRKTRPSPCRRGCNGMRGAAPSVRSSPWLGRPAAACG